MLLQQCAVSVYNRSSSVEYEKNKIIYDKQITRTRITTHYNFAFDRFIYMYL